MQNEIHEPPYTYEDFLHIIKVLRSDNGCPWDREQTHMSLRPCMMEEAAEVVAGIRIYEETGNYENLREELGDVLLQVVMHAQIAGEEGHFTMDDVVNEVAEKMVHRHPHVFGNTSVNGSDQVLENWEEIKKKEKESRSQVLTPLREIPGELPALTRASKVLKKIDKLYEPGEDYSTSADRLCRAADRLSELDPDSNGHDTAGNAQEAASIMGDLLMAASNIARIYKLPQEQLLDDRIEKLIRQYEA